MNRARRSTMLFSAVALACSFAFNAIGQSTVADRYVISAKAGGVNHLEGAVTIQRANGTSGTLLRRDRVEIGDRITTGQDGKAEILLNPGSYIRLGGESSFEFGSTDLEDLQIAFDSGSAMFEVFASNEFRVSVTTPKGKVLLTDSGIYRIDIAGDGTAVLSVTKGKAQVGDATATIVKEGKTGTITGGIATVGKFDKDKRDALGEWSRNRSKELGKFTSSLQSKQLSNTLLNSYNMGGWNIYDSFGLWIYDVRYGYSCFLPFGNGWRSPYGWWYGNGIYWHNLPGIYIPPIRQVRDWETVKNPRAPGTPVNPAATVKDPRVRSAVQDGNSSVKGPRTPRQSYEPPPFTRIQRETGSSVRNGDFSNDDSMFRSTSPRSYSPQITSVPAPPPAPVTPPYASSRKDN